MKVEELEINLKFNTMKQATKEAEHIVRVAKEEANKIDGCIYRIFVGVSSNEGCLGEFKAIKKKTKGRPRKKFKIYDCITKNKNPNTRKIRVNKHIHLHPVFVAMPATQFGLNICKHINKIKGDTVIKTHPRNKGYIDYVKKQATYYRQGGNDINNILDDV